MSNKDPLGIDIISCDDVPEGSFALIGNTSAVVSKGDTMRVIDGEEFREAQARALEDMDRQIAVFFGVPYDLRNRRRR